MDEPLLCFTYASFVFHTHRRGSVIAFFTVQYASIERDQIVTFNADLLQKHTVSGMNISDDIHIVIPQGITVLIMGWLRIYTKKQKENAFGLL